VRLCQHGNTLGRFCQTCWVDNTDGFRDDIIAETNADDLREARSIIASLLLEADPEHPASVRAQTWLDLQR
jgi:hypothetical protein